MIATFIKDKKIKKILRKQYKVKCISKKSHNIKYIIYIFRSNKFIYATIINKLNGNVLTSCSDLKLKLNDNKVNKAKVVGENLAKKVLNINSNLNKNNFNYFFRNYSYHGRVKNLIESFQFNLKLTN